MAKWLLKQSSANMEELTRQTGGDPVLARILAVRGFKTAEAVAHFMQEDSADLASPLLFADMLTAVQIAADAIEAQCKCVVYGDYDADGVMSTVILFNTLQSLGCDVHYYIPNRVAEGYGLNNQAVHQLQEQGVEVIFACDNGISAFAQVELANSLGMTVVILDHHAVTVEYAEDGKVFQKLPPADAVVDAKRVDCTYPFKSYCAAGVCYRFSQALYDYLEMDWTQLQKQLLPFAAFATVCDLVEMHGENRLLVKRGLAAIPTCENPGIRALIAATGLQGREIGAYHIGYILGPCVNAAGRLETADVAVELFLTTNLDRANQLANRLVDLNRQRRQLTENGAKIAEATIVAQNLAQDKVIVLHCTQISESVAGIIAGRVKEKYHRPTIILVGDGDMLRGSGRSIEGYNIHDGLSACRDLLLEFGGHPMAAGLSISADNVTTLRERLNAQCRLTAEDMLPVYRIDCPLIPAAADLQLAKRLLLLEPFGKDNPAPLFVATSLRLVRLAVLGKERNVIRWQFQQPDGRFGEAIDFSGQQQLQMEIAQHFGLTVWRDLLAGSCKQNVLLDMIYTVSINHFNGRESVQLQVVSFRISKYSGV